MRKKFGSYLLFCFCTIALVLLADIAMAQGQLPPGAPMTMPYAPQRDTSTSKTNTNEWQNGGDLHLTLRQAHSERLYTLDSSIHTFHRRQFLQPWYRNLGNHGGPVYNMVFTPEYRVGPTLGYHVYDVYRFNPDSLFYYNTNRPYSAFNYRLGSKLEQTAELIHSQNITPGWNFAAQYRKTTSPGYYQIQRTNNDNGALTTNYQSKNQRYLLFGAFVYNNEQTDENGGLVSDAFLSTEGFGDRKTIPVNFPSMGTNARNPRSAISNVMRDYSFTIQHGYTFGKTDTTFNEDSTRYNVQLTPRFRLTHRFQFNSEKHTYKDQLPDSVRYSAFFAHNFADDDNPDSVYCRQKWYVFDNRLALNGFLGKREKQLLFNAGLGVRYDDFRTEDGLNHVSNKIGSTYLTGEIRKDALIAKQWFYNGNLLLFLTGEAAGNSLLQAEVGKDISRTIGMVSAGFRQTIGNAPYNYTYYQNQFDTITANLNKQSVTLLHATLSNDRFKVSAGFRNYIVGNYIYLNQSQLPENAAAAFNVTQVWLRKIFTWKILVLDNELVFQPKAGVAPINVPTFFGRHQLSIETNLFRSALQIATGVEVRYHSPYDLPGYSPFFNRFYYLTGSNTANPAELSAFFNFRIGRFRAYLMGDQLQRLFGEGNNIINVPGYPGPDAMLRFGFNWVLIN